MYRRARSTANGPQPRRGCSRNCRTQRGNWTRGQMNERISPPAHWTLDTSIPCDWPRMWELFHAARQADPAQQAAFLDQACGGDQNMRQQIEELLRAHDRAGGFLEIPAIDLDTAPNASHDDAPPLPERI